MAVTRWAAAADRLMRHNFHISLSDAGLGPDDIERYARDFTDPQEFVLWFGRKYALRN